MQVDKIVSLWAKSGLLWLLFTMLFGVYLGATHQFGISSPHAHAGLLGGLWAIGFSYLFSRAPGDTNIRFAFWQWALFNIGVACKVSALWMMLMVDPKWGNSDRNKRRHHYIGDNMDCIDALAIAEC